MKNHKFWQSFENMAAGKGFYIVLALCLTAVGLSGYYLLDAVTTPLRPATTQTPVTVPEPQEVLTPAEEQTPARPVQKPAEVTLPDDAETVSTPQPEPAESVSAQQTKPELDTPTVFTWPVKGEILREFSVETLSLDPTMGDWRTHAGLDVAAALGTRVLCLTEGDVTDVWEDERLGTCIRVEHGGKLESVYANLAAQPTVKVGDHMEIGAILGAVGNTASAESGLTPHLHLETFQNGSPIDPTELLPKS